MADREGNTPSTAASSVEGLVENVRLPLEAGADKDATDNDGRMFLIVASVRGHVGIVRLLLEAGANKDVADTCGQTPLIAASARGHADIVRFRPRQECSRQRIALLLAPVHGQSWHEIVLLLLFCCCLASRMLCSRSLRFLGEFFVYLS